MAFPQITRPQTPLQMRDQIVAYVNEHFDSSAKFYFNVRKKLPRMYDVWRGLYTGRHSPHKNNVHVPFIYAAIWADAARKTSASLNQWPIVEFRGYGPDDKPIAMKHEQLISAQMKDSNSFMKEVNTHVCAGLYGLAVSKVQWDRRWDHLCYDQYSAMPLSSERVRTIHEADVITFDGPNHDNLDLLDWYPQIGPVHVNAMSKAGDRYYLDLDQVRQLSKPSPGGKPAIFDPAEVARMEREGSFSDKVSEDMSDRRYAARLGMSDDISKTLDKFSRPVEMREFYGTIPSEYQIQGCTRVIITVANRKYLMRARPYPFWHLQLPYVTHSPNPDRQALFPAGKAEVVEKLQLTANRGINQRLDANDLTIDPQIIYNRNAGVDTENLYSYPGQWIGVDGNPSEMMAPLSYDMRGMQVGAQMTMEMASYIERGTGISDDVVQGFGTGPDRETARGVLARREAAGSRLMLESRIYEEGYLEPLANMYQRLNRQFLEGPVEANILGDSARFDPDTKAPIQDTRVTLEGYELAVNYMARAVGASSNLSRMLRRQELVPLLQSVSSNPYTAGAINFVNFLRQVFREFEFDNVNELLKDNSQQSAQLQGIMEQAQQGGSQNPETIPDMAGGGDSMMQMSQLLGGQQ